MPSGVVGGTLGRVGSTGGGDPPVEFDSFATEATVGPLPWWEAGGPTGTVQPRNTPYKSGIAFRATADILVHGARIWAIYDDAGNTPTDHDAKLRFGPAQIYTNYTHSVDFDNSQPTDQSQWRTVMFAAPIPVAIDEEVVVYTSVWTGSNEPAVRQVARSEGGTAGEVLSGGFSLDGLMQTLDPQGWYTTTPIAGDDAEDYVPLYGRTQAWYWVDPLVTPA